MEQDRGAEPPITPLPRAIREAVAAGRVATLILLGGTFDPVQRAHTELAERARRGLESTSAGEVWLAYVPAACSPFKPGGPIAGDADRVAMLLIALGGGPGPAGRAAVWTDELDRARHSPAPSYSVDTVRRARRVLDDIGEPGARVTLRLLIGADQAVEFHRWREPRAIIDIAEPLVMLRPGDHGAGSPAELDRALHATGDWSPSELAAWSRRVISVGTMSVSSTQVRDELARRPRSEARLRELLDEPVLAYINKRGLYINPAVGGA